MRACVYADTDGSLADFDRALTLQPHNTQALYLRGKTRRYLKRNAEAVADLRAAIDQVPDNEYGLADMIYEVAAMMIQDGATPDEIEMLLQRGTAPLMTPPTHTHTHAHNTHALPLSCSLSLRSLAACCVDLAAVGPGR